MTKNEFLNLSTEEIIELLNNGNFVRQTIEDKNVFSLIFKNLSEDNIITILENRYTVLNEKNENGIVFVEYLADLGKSEVLEYYASHIDLSKRDYQGERNMLGFLAKKGMKNVIVKALENNPSVLNGKDVVGCVGVERLADVGFEDVLLQYGKDIDLLKRDYAGQYNMLGYLAKKGMKSVIMKALENNPGALNEKDIVGCVGTERLADAGYEDVLIQYGQDIDLLKRDYAGQYNMLGYLAKKKMYNAIDSALEKNPSVLNEKDIVGCVGTERLVDANAKDILEKYALYIDLLKRDYAGQYNMLGYLAKKGMKTVIDTALENNPRVLNEKDVVGCVGTERLIDAGYEDILVKFAQHIDLLKRDYAGQYNMLGYLAKKKMKDVLSLGLKHNPMVVNEKDIVGCLGTERLADVGYSIIIWECAEVINWNRNATDGQTLFQYVIKKCPHHAKEIAIKATIKNPEILINNLKYIIDTDIHSILQYKEIISHLNKNLKVDDMNILTYLTKKGREDYIRLMLDPKAFANNNVHKEKEIEKTDNSSNIEVWEKLIEPLKVVPDMKKEVKKDEPLKTIKARIKSML